MSTKAKKLQKFQYEKIHKVQINYKYPMQFAKNVQSTLKNAFLNLSNIIKLLKF